VPCAEAYVADQVTTPSRSHRLRLPPRNATQPKLTPAASCSEARASPEVVEALRYTSGSMRAAALAAWRGGGITVSPTSGFHHAGYGHGGGYCTFNGLVVAALAVLDAGARQLAIIDCDYHYGDGTDDILLRLDLHDTVRHWTLGAHNMGNERQVLEWLEAALAENLPGNDLVIYQAGADSHEDDPLGGVFTTDGYPERDRMVFSAAACAGVPVAWNLAGGYQEHLSKVLELHAITTGRRC
jgi:acetoin utilization deacetylase AcuC-like enzyme